MGEKETQTEIKIGEVIDRPTGELALLWHRFAAVLDHREQQARARKKAERRANNPK